MFSEGSNAPSVCNGGVRAGEERSAQPPDLAGPDAAPQDPRVVTTGGKREAERPDSPNKEPKGYDAETGEAIDIYAVSPRAIRVVRLLKPDPMASPGIAQLDALSFTVKLPEDASMHWVVQPMQQFLPVESFEPRGGCFGFQHSVRFGDGAGIIAWGGKSQRDRVYFSIQGKGCALVRDWPALAEWLQEHRANLKRIDVAYDDFKGETVSIAWAVAQYRAEGFNAGGRRPQHSVHGDWLADDASEKGRTLGIGNRASGKYCRIYEKGKQLGAPDSPWTRIEVEWHGKDRVIPFDILTEPGKYLAGAYPCTAFLNIEQSRIKTIANGATIVFESAVANLKQHGGKLINLMVDVHAGDVGEVVKRLRRDGIPARIEPYSYHLADTPELLDRNAPGSFAAMLTTE